MVFGFVDPHPSIHFRAERFPFTPGIRVGIVQLGQRLRMKGGVRPLRLIRCPYGLPDTPTGVMTHGQVHDVSPAGRWV